MTWDAVILQAACDIVVYNNGSSIYVSISQHLSLVVYQDCDHLLGYSL